MGNTKVTEFPAAGALDGTELVPIVQGGATKQTTIDDLIALVGTVDLPTLTATLNGTYVAVEGTITKIDGPMTQAAYDALTPDADTLYVIVG